jgi:hypothetical protein
MKKLILTFIAFSVIGLFFNCSTSEDITEPNPPVIVITPPVVTSPPTVTIPATNLMKPAIRNINKSSKTSRGLEENKKILKSVTYANNGLTGQLLFYKLNDTLSQTEYEKIPTDYKYDESEELLNKDLYKANVTNYFYNGLGQLIQIKSMRYNSADPNGYEQSTYFTYDGNGKVSTITDYFGSVFAYNPEGLINKRTQFDGKNIEIYSYDSQQRVTSSTRWIFGPMDDINAPIDTWDKSRTDYIYNDIQNNKYFEIWFTSFNDDGSVRNNSMRNVVKYDDSKPGIKNKEPLYMIDNAYVHNKDGKFFYNTDGYLRKYDASSTNSAGSITIFYYEQ